jgi:flagellar motor switch protein FliN
MNIDAAKIVVEGLLKGALGMLDAKLSKSFRWEYDESAPVDQEQLTELAQRFPVAFDGSIRNELGIVIMMFPEKIAAQFSDLVQGRESGERESIDESDVKRLEPIAAAVLGGGVASLMERLGRGIEPLESTEVSHPADATALLMMTGLNAIATPFHFSDDGGCESDAILLHDAALESLASGEASPDSASEALVSEAEMSDILSGLNIDEGDKPSAPSAPSAPSVLNESMSANLDMVLDIRLEATARLGRIEMPISEILNLGPGSVIEVGHLVDEPIELLINDKLIARGDVVVVDEKFGLRITEIITPRERIESLR